MTKPLTLLAVDDDELVLFSTAGILEAAGHRVLTARSAGKRWICYRSTRSTS